MIAYLFTGLFVLILISAALAPLESLGWWAGWFGEHEAPGSTPEQPETTADPARPAKQVTSYLVYLSGIGAIDGTSIPSEESVFLEMLRTHVPGALLVSDVFPYSVTNAGLTSRRVGKRVFAWVEQRRLNNPLAVEQLIINLRNMFQVAVSADQRYGPIYNLGVAREIVRAIEKEGDGIIKGVPISILGWSGGGQIALGAAPFLRSMLRAPVRIISVGGVMSDDPGLDSVEHVYHFYGTKDPIQAIGQKLYAGRWKYFPQSRWNRAIAQGKITMTCVGPFTHIGTGNYWDPKTTMPDGRSHAQVTLDLVTGVLTQDGLLAATATAAPTDATVAPTDATTATATAAPQKADSSL